MSTTLLPVSSVATVLNVSRWTVYRLLSSGEIPYVDVDTSGRKPRIRVSADAVERFIAERTHRAA